MNAQLTFVVYYYRAAEADNASRKIAPPFMLARLLWNSLARYTYDNDFGRELRIVCKLARENVPCPSRAASLANYRILRTICA